MATPGHFLEKTVGVIPLTTTIWSPAAIIHEIVFTTAVIVAMTVARVVTALVRTAA